MWKYIKSSWKNHWKRYRIKSARIARCIARQNNSYKSSKLHYFASSFLLLPKKVSHLYVTLFMISLYLFHKKTLRKKMKNDRKYMYQTWVRPRQSVRTFPTIYVKPLQSTVTPLPLLLPPSSFFPNYRVYPTPWNFRRFTGLLPAVLVQYVRPG